MIPPLPDRALTPETPCDCNDTRWYEGNRVVLRDDFDYLQDTYLTADAEPHVVRLKVARTLNEAPGWQDARKAHRLGCDNVYRGFQADTCARCGADFLRSSDLVPCPRCEQLWIASEFYSAASGWFCAPHDISTRPTWDWYASTDGAGPITEQVLRAILDARKAGGLLYELHLRFRFWQLPKGLDTEGAYLLPAEPLVDGRGGQWGTVADSVVNPLSGYGGERRLMRRAHAKARWYVLSQPIHALRDLGGLTLANTWGSEGSGRKLVVVGDKAHRVPDRVLDREIATAFRKAMQKALG